MTLIVNHHLTIVDTPGFGKNQSDSVNKALIPYLISESTNKESSQIAHILFLISLDQNQQNQLEKLTKNHFKVLQLLAEYYPSNFSIVINKIDNGSGSLIVQAVCDFIKLFESNPAFSGIFPKIFVCSGKTGEGVPLLKSFMMEEVKKFKEIQSKIDEERQEIEDFVSWRPKN